ncbi:three-helix bundle dimerization domain-containing protein [Amycolatopsis samaneae]|uniref:Three-helix bundle dimerization domain-containing protein n=1 Tax=Amycolatopsis samaneae TaxID=664691 RepID=A0ABW5GU34_9PSEU
MRPTSVDDLDDTQIEERIQQLEQRLAREHDRMPSGLVHRMVEYARARFAHARIRRFVPILVERTVRAHLDLTTGAAGRSGPAAAGNGPRPYSMPEWARVVAHRLLSGDLPRRWAHTQGVARRAGEVGTLFVSTDREVLVAAAWLHDIGYAPALVRTGFHPVDGARFLGASGVPDRVCALVAHHTGAAAVADLLGLSGELARFPDERGAVRDALWFCDMTTSPDGEPVSYADRLAELRARRGPADPVVRALAVNGSERAAAVRRTEQLLEHVETRAAGRSRCGY